MLTDLGTSINLGSGLRKVGVFGMKGAGLVRVAIDLEIAGKLSFVLTGLLSQFRVYSTTFGKLSQI